MTAAAAPVPAQSPAPAVISIQTPEPSVQSLAQTSQAPAPFVSLLNPSAEEIQSVASCNLATHLIAIKYDGSQGPKIVTIARSDVTCWQLFLKILGWGKLAKTDLTLTKVAPTLAKYNWRQFSTAETSSVNYQAYYNMCTLAGKALLKMSGYRSDRTRDALWRSVSTGIERPITVLLLQDAREREQSVTATRNVYINPIAQVKHIRRFFHLQFNPSVVRFDDIRTQEALNGETLINTPEQIRNINIVVRQRISLFSGFSSSYDPREV